MIYANYGINRAMRARISIGAALSLIACGMLIAGDEKTPAQGDTVKQKIHALTQSARSASDFSQIIEQCQAAIDGKVSESEQKYLRSVKSWSLNRRCELRAVLAADFIEANNRAQANLIADQALADAIEAIELDSTRWRAFLNRGMLLADSNMLNEALADFQTVCQLQPKESLGWYNCGEAQSALLDFAAAVDSYTRALEIDSGDLQALTGRGLARCHMSDFEAATKDFDFVVRMRGNDAAALTNRGDARQGLGQWRDAYDDYLQAAKIEDNGVPSARAAWLLATCPEEEFYRPDAAMDLAKHSIEKAGENVNSLEALAAAHACKGEFEKAIETQKRAIRLCAITNSECTDRLKLYEQQKPFVR